MTFTDPASPEPVQQAQAGVAAPAGPPTPSPGRARSVGLRRAKEGGIMAFLVASGLFTLLTTVAIIAILSRETYRFFDFHEPTVEDVSTDRLLAGRFVQDDDGWQFVVAPDQRAAVLFLTLGQRDALYPLQAGIASRLERIEELEPESPGPATAPATLPASSESSAQVVERLRGEVEDLRRQAVEQLAALGDVFAGEPDAAQVLARLQAGRVVRPGDEVRLPAPGRGGIEPTSAEARELEAARERELLEQQRAEAADDPGAPKKPGASADADETADAPAPAVDVDDYAAFDVAAVRPDRLILSSGPGPRSPVRGTVVASVWHDVVSPWQFLTGLRWSPLLGSEHYFGILPLVAGTLMVTAVAMVVAVPLGLITAIYLSEYAPRRVRSVLKPTLEVLAGIPTVVFGFFALTTITPALQWLSGGFGIYNAASAGIAVGILTLPIVTSLIEDALRAVPRSLREASYGLGATRVETSLNVVVPAALSGIIAAVLLAVARAVGETMIVALAAGATPLPLSTDPAAALDPRSEVQPMTGYMVQIFLGDASNFGPEYLSSYAVAATLFVMTLVLTVVGHQVRVRFHQVYE